jgi:hypothetical protein
VIDLRVAAGGPSVFRVIFGRVPVSGDSAVVAEAVLASLHERALPPPPRRGSGAIGAGAEDTSWVWIAPGASADEIVVHRAVPRPAAFSRWHQPRRNTLSIRFRGRLDHGARTHLEGFLSGAGVAAPICGLSTLFALLGIVWIATSAVAALGGHGDWGVVGFALSWDAIAVVIAGIAWTSLASASRDVVMALEMALGGRPLSFGRWQGPLAINGLRGPRAPSH